jgi:protein transport protein SEC61 subunit alpha
MLVSNLYNISAILSSRFKNSIIVKIFGDWQNGKAVGGITYYISPPESMYDLVTDPIRSFVYISFVCITCAFFAR